MNRRFGWDFVLLVKENAAAPFEKFLDNSAMGEVVSPQARSNGLPPGSKVRMQKQLSPNMMIAGGARHFAAQIGHYCINQVGEAAARLTSPYVPMTFQGSVIADFSILYRPSRNIAVRNVDLGLNPLEIGDDDGKFQRVRLGPH